jgi:glycosyltransferase involved in cell wall biosynthesis
MVNKNVKKKKKELNSINNNNATKTIPVAGAGASVSVSTSTSTSASARASSSLPFVSLCTPTFNRRPFIPYMIKCFEHQDYPKDRIEWIIIDDGTDKIGDLVKHIPQVKYFSYETQMVLGKKRNLMHSKSRGDILVYMDDDDYYPPERISHAVDTLTKNPKALCAGSSEINIYFKHIEKMYQFGPYRETHATAGTFAFRRQLLKFTRYDDNAALAEEKSFLKDYTIPFVQLDPMKSILVFSHIQNTFDKRRLLENINPQFTKESTKTVDMFIKDADIKDFYMNQIEVLLKTYEPGRPNMKPEVLKQMVSIEKERKEEMDKIRLQQQQQQQMMTLTITRPDGFTQTLTLDQIIQKLQEQEAENNQLKNMLQGKETEIRMLNSVSLTSPDGAVHQLNMEQVVGILQQQQSVINELNTTIKKKEEEIEILRKNARASMITATETSTSTSTFA